jgi:hypothetical protein
MVMIGLLPILSILFILSEPASEVVSRPRVPVVVVEEDRINRMDRMKIRRRSS